MTRIVAPTDQALQDAAAVICAGGLVAMPTETVYGLAANALDACAVARVYAAKGRPSSNPLILHCHDLSQVLQYVKLKEGGGKPLTSEGEEESSDDGKESCATLENVQALARQFWPGPLTLVLPRNKDAPVSQAATAGLDTIAVRIPGHKTARTLIEKAGVPLVAPSANKSGQISPTTPLSVDKELGEAVDMILAAGPCTIGLESTVLDLSGPEPVILRPGFIHKEALESVLNRAVSYHFEVTHTPKAPGQMPKHYAPRIPVRLNAIDVKAGEALLAFGAIKFMGLEGGGAARDLPDTMIRNLSEEGDLEEAAVNLYEMMRALDRPEHTAIAVMSLPQTGLGLAINDRLKRAAQTG